MSLFVLVPTLIGFVLTLLPSVLGLLLIARGVKASTYVSIGKSSSPRWFILMLGLSLQVPAIIYLLSLYNTGLLHLLLGLK